MPSACAALKAARIWSPTLAACWRRQRAVRLHDLPQRPGSGLNSMTIHGPPVVFDDVVDRHHVRVAQPGRGPRLAQRPLPEHLTLMLGHVGGRGYLLDSDLAGEDVIVGEPHGAHTAVAERRDQVITARDDMACNNRRSHAVPSYPLPGDETIRAGSSMAGRRRGPGGRVQAARPGGRRPPGPRGTPLCRAQPLTCGIEEIVDCAWVSAELTDDVPVIADWIAVHSACDTFG